MKKNNLIKWLNKEELERFNSYTELFTEIQNHLNNDYLFFPFLIGYVKRYLNRNTTFQDMKNLTLKLIYDLLKDDCYDLYFVTNNMMVKGEWKDISELNVIISQIDEEWIKLKKEEPDMNELVWLSCKDKLKSSS